MLRSAAAALFLFACAASAADPEGWEAFKINDKKKPTHYRLLDEDGSKVLHARAEASASGMKRTAATFSILERPVATWSWKVSRLISAADNSKAGGEDAPVRIVLAFDGDRSKLPKRDQAVMRVSRRLSGQDMPYATLMYIWSNTAPVGSVIENPHTRRVQMVVASSGAAGVGAWQKLSRDVLADYRLAFKEEPGKLLGFGVMSDTDNTGETVEAWYGPIDFRRRK